MNGMQKMLIGLVALIAIGLGGTYYSHHLAVAEAKNRIKIGNTTVQVELADTPAARKQGLSGRGELREGKGMLFVLDEAGQPGFWMKDMNFALDIIWIDSENRVVGVEKDITPETYPKIFWPSKAIQYVLEVPAGFAQRHGVDIGSEVFF